MDLNRVVYIIEKIMNYFEIDNYKKQKEEVFKKMILEDKRKDYLEVVKNNTID